MKRLKVPEGVDPCGRAVPVADRRRTDANGGAALLALIAACITWLPCGASAADAHRIRIAGAQIPVGSHVSANVEAITRAITYAAREKADVLVTPEGSLSGYSPDFDAKATRRGLETVLQRARTAGVALVLGTCFEDQQGRRYNAQRFYAKDGRELGIHAKILLCRRMADPLAKSEIDCFQSKPLRTFTLAGFTVGGLICNDMWANPEWTPMDDPHLAQRLADMSTDIIFVSAYTGRSVGEAFALSRAYHDSNLRLRARAARRWIVVVNAAEATGEKKLHAPSGVLAPDGTWALAVSPSDEQFFAKTIEIDPRASSGVSQ